LLPVRYFNGTLISLCSKFSSFKGLDKHLQDVHL